MDTEYEVKFYPVDKEKLRKKLKKLGAKLTHPERKMRRSIADNRVNTGLKCDYIRVRDESDLIRLSAKIHAVEGGKVGDQKEVDVKVSDYDKTVEFLKAAGFVFNRYHENLRETWEFDQAEITIDTWPGLEPYTEIEANSQDRVRGVAKKLGFNWDNKIITSVVEVYMKVYKIDEEKALEKTSNITFENNPFKGLQANHNI